MDRDGLLRLLAAVRDRKLTVEEALEELRVLPYRDLGFAKVDHHRALRQGLPEVVFCQGKTPAQVAAIMCSLAERHANVLATRAAPEAFAAVRERLPAARYHEAARAITLCREPAPPDLGPVTVITAGTADIPVAEEAAVTAGFLGCRVVRLYDVGVAGMHRLLDHREVLREGRVFVVAAGMDGALPSVVGGLVDRPVIAVPTSVGYGASFGGLAALLTMLNSCAPGVAVVNIDNGFGAAVLAASILRLARSG
ncbi:MAG: nickel pincer cofactor biosynthesis protein LarB [Firmicutes bacterium]|nr:nickel pincer cofactor biosynthesis protein LarB [Bacillota bacterium]